jgi:hypothetical protein
MMNLGNYQINAHEDVFHRITLEIRTKLDTITKEQYVRITMSVLQYMGREGFFDKRLPNQLAIYNKFGQLQRVEDMA